MRDGDPRLVGRSGTADQCKPSLSVRLRWADVHGGAKRHPTAAPAEHRRRPQTARLPAQMAAQMTIRGDSIGVARMVCPVVIGREAELTVLRAALGRARRGAGGLALLLGEAGIGKSRLAQEVASAAAGHGMSVLRGRAVGGRSLAPFRPVAEAIAAGVRSGGPPDDPQLQPFRPLLAQLVPEWHDHRVPVDASPVLLAEAVIRLLRVLAGRSGCLVLLEDLHWADPETLAIVEYLADNLTTEAVLCLATVRSEEPSDGLGLARALDARRAATVIELPRLGPDDVAAMVAACLGEAETDVTSTVTTYADGVPFLVEELLAAGGASGAPFRVPRTFAAVIEQRLAELDPPSRRLVRAAAVLGRRFDWRRALAELDTGMGLLRTSPVTVPSHLRGLWALVRSVEDHRGQAAIDEIAASGVLVNRLNRADVGYARAVLAGRADDAAAAGEFMRAADQEAAHAPWWCHHARRLVAEAALADEWGDPEVRVRRPRPRVAGDRRLRPGDQGRRDGRRGAGPSGDQRGLRRLPAARRHDPARQHLPVPGRPGVTRGQVAATFSRTQSTMSCVGVPGVKTLRTPRRCNSGMSSSGMIPPPNTAMSVACRSRRSCITRANSVRCAPDSTESPIPSASSWMAASTICSGVWCRPV
jgi:hypothetical protein